MHEWTLAQQVARIVRAHLPAGDRQRVTSVKLRIGELTGVTPASLTACVGLLSPGTALEGAALEVEQVAGDEVRVIELRMRGTG